jgi:hypothetical protein
LLASGLHQHELHFFMHSHRYFQRTIDDIGRAHVEPEAGVVAHFGRKPA